MLGTAEHYALMQQFEKDAAKMTATRLRFDKEDKALWPKGIIYQDGLANDLFRLYALGYSFGRFTERT